MSSLSNPKRMESMVDLNQILSSNSNNFQQGNTVGANYAFNSVQPQNTQFPMQH